MIHSVKHGIKVIIRVFAFALLVFPSISYSQNCSCPAIGTCAPCSGGMISLTLQFNGLSASEIVVTDQMGIVFSGTVNASGLFSFVGLSSNGKFSGSQIQLTVNTLQNATISINCSTQLFIGNNYGSFTIIEGQSYTNGSLCCSPAVIEKIPPVITNCPDNIEIDIVTNQCAVEVNWQPPTATDNCELKSLFSDHVPGETFAIGRTKVVYTATDIFGNTSTCDFTVFVNPAAAPIVTGCPEQIRIEADENGEAVVQWVEPQASACTAITSTKTHEPGTVFSIGTTLVVYTFTDADGNRSTCSFNVVVRAGEFPLEINKALTPDGDGINDTWRISNIENYKNNTVIIIDRWGNTIFSATGYDNGGTVWKGTNTNGDLVPTGTYFYSIQIEEQNGVQRKKGFIEVVR